MKLIIAFGIAALASFWTFILFQDFRARSLVQTNQEQTSISRVNDTSLVTNDPLPVPTLGLTLAVEEPSEAVEIQKKGTGSFVAYTQGQPIQAGDTVRVVSGEQAVLTIPQLGSLQLVDGASAGFINTLPKSFLIQYSGEIAVNGSADSVISFRSLGVLVAFNNAVGTILSDETDGIFVRVQSGNAEIGYLDFYDNPVTYTVEKGESVQVNDGEIIVNE